ncbi:MAG: T9SS type A sorting domain-containing protein, partial [Bacteroidota bacterium]
INSISQTTVFNNGNEIVIHSTSNDLLHLRFYNLNGQLELKRRFHQSTSFASPTISGIYIYEIISENGKVTEKGKFCIVPK